MATNDDGHIVDSSGAVAVDFVWGNLPMQPNDERDNTKRLDVTLDNHITAVSGWNGYPQYTPNTTGEDVAGPTDYVLVPNVLGLTTALAIDNLGDAALGTVTTATAATNTAKTVTAAARTLGSKTTTITASGAGAAYPVGTKITVTNTGDATVNGTWTVTTSATNTVTFEATGTTAVSLTGLSGSVVGVTGTIKTQSIAAAADNIAPGTAITITPWA